MVDAVKRESEAALHDVLWTDWTQESAPTLFQRLGDLRSMLRMNELLLARISEVQAKVQTIVNPQSDNEDDGQSD